MTAGILNLVALVVFASALCWRLDQIRRHGGGLQALAMTISIAALTLAFVVANHTVADALDEKVFAGSSRLAFYALLAIGVAALIVVFFYPGSAVSRERRAGIEAVPLVVALIGLQVSLVFMPDDIRSEPISEWTLKSWGFAIFYLIASAYLAYGFAACVRSIGKFLRVADGYLRTSLLMLIGGLGLLAVGSLVQIVFVLGGVSGSASMPWLLTTSRVLDVLGVVAFLVGISFPMLHSRWKAFRSRGRRRRDSEVLTPLWQLVTGAVPEVVLPDRRGGPTAMLHRRVVEIRDALTQLSPYLPLAFDHAVPSVRAAMLRTAAAEYREVGRSSGAVRTLLPPDGDGLDADAAPLLPVAVALADEPVGSMGRHRSVD
ncbi:hypothetical protein GCM10009624_27280 [Gordonia sinesedis]